MKASSSSVDDNHNKSETSMQYYSFSIMTPIRKGGEGTTEEFSLGFCGCKCNVTQWNAKGVGVWIASSKCQFWLPIILCKNNHFLHNCFTTTCALYAFQTNSDKNKRNWWFASLSALSLLILMFTSHCLQLLWKRMLAIH